MKGMSSLHMNLFFFECLIENRLDIDRKDFGLQIAGGEGQCIFNPYYANFVRSTLATSGCPFQCRKWVRALPLPTTSGRQSVRTSISYPSYAPPHITSKMSRTVAGLHTPQTCPKQKMVARVRFHFCSADAFAYV